MRSLVESHGFVARRYQAIASLALLMVLVGTSFMTDLIARNRALEKSLMALSSDFAEKNGTLFSNTGNFIDYEDRILLDEIPQADYSRGGVYFFGSSNMKWAFSTWDLPAEQKRLIGNYGIGAASHTDQLRLIQYLIKQRKFLTAGKQDLVILGVSFQDGRGDVSAYFPALFRRHGLYTFTPEGAIVPVPMNEVQRWLHVEKARSGGFLWNLGRVAKGWVATLVEPPHRPPMRQLSFDNLRGFMGPHWQQNMDVEMERLRQTILLLRSHQAKVKVMFLPEGTWDDKLPYKPRYEGEVRTLCKATSTPLIDFSRALPDQDFVDSSHLTVEGQRRFRKLIMKEIVGHLQILEKTSSRSSIDGDASKP